jgi:hypothetical protein
VLAGIDMRHVPTVALCSRNSATVGRSSEPENHERRLQLFSRRADAPRAAQRNCLLAGTAARAQELAGVSADMQSAQIGARISNEGSASRQQCNSYC